MKAGFIKYHRAVLGILRQAVFSAPAEFGTNGGPAMRNADAFGRDQAGAAVLGSLLFGARGSSAENVFFKLATGQALITVYGFARRGSYR